MKHSWFVVLAHLWMVALFGAAQEQDRKTEVWEKPFHHEVTGIILPTDIAGFRIAERTAYGGGGFDGSDVSVRYVDDLTKIDVYFTEVKGISFDPENPYAHHSNAIGRVIDAIQSFAKRGVYHDLEVGESAAVSTFGGSVELPLVMADTVLTYRQSENGNEAGVVENVRRESSIGVTFFREYQVKVRHTFLLANNPKAVAERREKRKKFHADLCSLIAEVSHREEVTEAIAALKENPADPDAASLIVTYAEESSLVKLTVSPEQMPFLLDDNFKAANELLAAFISGNVEAQLKQKEYQDQGGAGVAQMLSSYEFLKMAGKCGGNRDLEAMLEIRDHKDSKKSSGAKK